MTATIEANKSKKKRKQVTRLDHWFQLRDPRLVLAMWFAIVALLLQLRYDQQC